MSAKNRLDRLSEDHTKDRHRTEDPKRKTFANNNKFDKNNGKRGRAGDEDDGERPRRAKFVRHQEEDDLDDSDLDDDEELKISREDIDFNLPKPGPHAKSNEWRKWKQMQRAIRQIREEKRILKREKQEKEKLERQDLEAEDAGGEEGRNFTLSIAIPGSIFGKVQSKELKTYVAGQIARAAVLFCVDEIVVYNDYSIENTVQTENIQQLVKILEYLECPQYLRKALFPPHKYLEYVGLLNPLEALHHLKIDDEWKYREGVVTDIPSKEGRGSYIDVGLYNKVLVDKKLQPGIRVTVKSIKLENSQKLRGVVVSPETPRTEDGIYWGYQVRNASSFRKVIYETSFKEGYDLKIAIPNTNKMSFDHLKDKLPRAKHILVVFGGKDGIEAALEADEKLKANKIEQVFNFNCEMSKVKSQSALFGSRTIRLEEALLISLSLLRPHILNAYNAEATANGAEIEEGDDSNGDDDDDEDDDDGESDADGEDVNKSGADSQQEEEDNDDDGDEDEEDQEGSQNDED